jgi:hypothetical protein
MSTQYLHLWTFFSGSAFSGAGQQIGSLGDGKRYQYQQQRRIVSTNAQPAQRLMPPLRFGFDPDRVPACSMVAFGDDLPIDRPAKD